jgi:PAS domain S-box-containing protein
LIPDLSERALVVAPRGRDADIAADILRSAGIAAAACPSIAALVGEMASGAGFAIITAEALRSADLHPLRRWIEAQPEWSDFPFILLTTAGGGLERNPEAARQLQILNNVTFLERPFHPTTLVSLAQAALRGRRRQYEARVRLEELRHLTGSLERQVEERTAQLRVGEARMRAIFESNHQYQLLLDTDGTVLDANRASLDGAAAALSDVVGRPFWETPWFATTPGLPDLVRAAVRRVAAGETVNQEVEVQLPIGPRIFDFGMRPVRDAEGRVISLAPEAVDITDRRMAEEALRQSQKLEAMGQLTGGVAHDFNNLLTPIVGALDILYRSELGGPREQRLIEGAVQSAERARVLVQRLLAFARRQPLQPMPVDIARLVRGMADLVASTTGPQIVVEVDAANDLPSAQADPNQLEMAVLNLAVNARDAMPNGGTLRISAKLEVPGTRRPAGLADGRYIRLSVADTGTGMDEATRARAIEPFFSTKGVGKGTGLGLSMVHGLALQLGGALGISSRPGQGTRIHLWLPVTAAAADPVAVTEAPAMLRRDGVALLVDDEAVVRASTAHMLGEIGYRVIEAGSAEEAQALIDDGLAPDILVTDHLMPGRSGADLARAQDGAMPVLIVSGYAEVDEIAPDLPRITKPFRQDELSAMVSQITAEG